MSCLNIKWRKHLIYLEELEMEAISSLLSLSNSEGSESERREVVLGGDRCSADEGIIDVSVSMYKLDFLCKKKCFNNVIAEILNLYNTHIPRKIMPLCFIV
jgi:hypothetical protein